MRPDKSLESVQLWHIFAKRLLREVQKTTVNVSNKSCCQGLFIRLDGQDVSVLVKLLENDENERKGKPKGIKLSKQD